MLSSSANTRFVELNKNLQVAIASENKEEVQKVAEQIEAKGQLMGPRAAKKTMLARQVSAEGRRASFAGGGSDLLALVKDQIVAPDVIIRLTSIKGADQPMPAPTRAAFVFATPGKDADGD